MIADGLQILQRVRTNQSISQYAAAWTFQPERQAVLSNRRFEGNARVRPEAGIAQERGGRPFYIRQEAGCPVLDLRRDPESPMGIEPSESAVRYCLLCELPHDSAAWVTGVRSEPKDGTSGLPRGKFTTFSGR